jgi:hypothetical protein
MIILPYNRQKAVEYAKEHAFKRDDAYFDFTDFGGNCTAFVSQCLYAANGIMNPTPVFAWYYYSSFNRSPSWSGVEFLFKFLTTNKTQGPFAKVANVQEMEIGDIVQLQFEQPFFTHTLIITHTKNNQPPKSERDIFVTANTFDVLNKNLTQYHYKNIRFLKVLGVFLPN